MTIPLWMAVVVIAGWGLWQLGQIRRTVLAQARQGEMRAALQDNGTTTRPAMAVESAAIVGSADLRGGMIPATIELNDPLLEPETMSSAGLERGALRLSEKELPIFDAAMTATELIGRGRRELDSGHIVEGRAALNAGLARAESESQAQALRESLATLNASVFLGTAILPDDPLAGYVEIRPGDSFLKLGREYAVPAAYLARINPGLNPRNLKPATGVKVVRGPFALKLVKHAGRMDLYARDLYVRSFGAEFPEGNVLPAGDYRIAQGSKIQVGARLWIGFEGAAESTDGVTSGWLYGTNGPRGSRARDRATGIRMADADLQQLYNVLVESRSHLQVEP